MFFFYRDVNPYTGWKKQKRYQKNIYHFNLIFFHSTFADIVNALISGQRYADNINRRGWDEEQGGWLLKKLMLSLSITVSFVLFSIYLYPSLSLFIKLYMSNLASSVMCLVLCRLCVFSFYLYFVSFSVITVEFSLNFGLTGEKVLKFLNFVFVVGFSVLSVFCFVVKNKLLFVKLMNVSVYFENEIFI